MILNIENIYLKKKVTRINILTGANFRYGCSYMKYIKLAIDKLIAIPVVRAKLFQLFCLNLNNVYNV